MTNKLDYILFPKLIFGSVAKTDENRSRQLKFFLFVFVFPSVFLFMLNIVLPVFMQPLEIGKHSNIKFIHENQTTILGIYLGLVGIFVSYLTYLTFKLSNARNIDEFINIFITLLSEASRRDKLVFIAPTFFIERKNNPELFERYKGLMISKLREGVSIDFIFFDLKFPFQDYAIETDNAEKTKTIETWKTQDQLINFHIQFLNAGEETIEYFDELSRFYANLRQWKNFKVFHLNADYKKSKFVVAANNTKQVFYTGNYFVYKSTIDGKEQMKFSFNVNLMEEKSEMDDIIKAFTDEFKV